ncbi:hypothetical protein [Streptomyces venezuelae]|uniref:hypothetical protein n=1 Tax=Streptomyces venezuelae TaxID=54571 RepID=UPI00343E573C
MLRPPLAVTTQRNGQAARGWRLFIGPEGTDPANRRTWLKLSPDAGTLERYTEDTWLRSPWRRTELRAVPHVGVHGAPRIVFGGTSVAHPHGPAAPRIVQVAYRDHGIFTLLDPQSGSVQLACRITTKVHWAPLRAARALGLSARSAA